jgi:hypothetical protein
MKTDIEKISILFKDKKIQTNNQQISTATGKEMNNTIRWKMDRCIANMSKLLIRNEE